jgi:hypothetical protein
MHRPQLPLRLLTWKGGRRDHSAIDRRPRPRITFGGPAVVAGRGLTGLGWLWPPAKPVTRRRVSHRLNVDLAGQRDGSMKGGMDGETFTSCSAPRVGGVKIHMIPSALGRVFRLDSAPRCCRAMPLAWPSAACSGCAGVCCSLSGRARSMTSELPVASTDYPAARRSLSVLIAAIESQTVCTQLRATRSPQTWPSRHRSVPSSPE